MDILTLLESGFGWTGERVARVRPDQLDAPTPCEKWPLRALLNHLIGAMEMLAGAVSGQPATGLDPQVLAETDRIGTDPAAAYRAAAERALAAWRAPGALERGCETPLGTLPAAVVARISLTDAVVHGWDVSRATGEHAEVPAELAEPLLESGKQLITPERRGRVFGPEVKITGGSPSDQLVAFLGRRP